MGEPAVPHAPDRTSCWGFQQSRAKSRVRLRQAERQGRSHGRRRRWRRGVASWSRRPPRRL